jgi:putative membrane protein
MSGYNKGMQILAKWAISALSLMIVANIVNGFTIESFYTALIAALVLGFLNTIVRPLLLLLTLPINLLTLGLFTLIINGGLIYFVGTFVKGFEITLSAAIIASILLWLVNMIINIAFKRGG